MTERTVNLGCAIAWALWTLAVLCILGGILIVAATDLMAAAMVLLAVGLALACGAATATIRTYFVAQNRMFKTAYDMGKESVAPLVPVQR